MIRRWTEQGVVSTLLSSEAGEALYDFSALTQFRRVRELRGQGLTLKQVEAELQGQMNLFKPARAEIAHLLSPFEEALLLHERGDAKAAELYREAITEGDNLADAYCNLGIIELEQGRMPKALDCFTLALKNEPRHVEAHYNLANLMSAICSSRSCITRAPLNSSRLSLRFITTWRWSTTSWMI